MNVSYGDNDIQLLAYTSFGLHKSSYIRIMFTCAYFYVRLRPHINLSICLSVQSCLSLRVHTYLSTLLPTYISNDQPASLHIYLSAYINLYLFILLCNVANEVVAGLISYISVNINVRTLLNTYLHHQDTSL